MSTFHPAASSLANFNDTLSTISTIRLFIYISCSHQNKNQPLSWHHSSHSLGDYMVNSKSTRRTYTRESKLSVVVVPRYQLFTQRLHHYRILAVQSWTISKISTTQLFCHVHMLPKRRRGFGVWSILAFIIKRILGIKRIFPCSLEISACAY